jgi:hypothetical protein
MVKIILICPITGQNTKKKIFPIAEFGDLAVVPLQHGGRVEWLYQYSITHVPSGLSIFPSLDKNYGHDFFAGDEFVTLLAEKLYNAGFCDLVKLGANGWEAGPGARALFDSILGEIL